MAKIQDQYADGEAARAWARFIGDAARRTRHYGAFLRRLLHAAGARSVLDVACGTGVDSVLLLEAGFQVTSTDASDQMLKHALRTRWQRRHEPSFDLWAIEEANWLSLPQDLEDSGAMQPELFDAVICLGNSFAHMPAHTRPHPDPQAEQRRALANFWQCVRPGGVLIVDHRNYDHILATGATPSSCFYYNNSVTDIRTSVVYVEGEPVEVAMDYEVGYADSTPKDKLSRFRLTYYPHRLEGFRKLLRQALGPDADAARHTVYADFRPTPLSGRDIMKNGVCDSDSGPDSGPDSDPDPDSAFDSPSDADSDADAHEPAVYVHVLQKPLESAA